MDYFGLKSFFISAYDSDFEEHLGFHEGEPLSCLTQAMDWLAGLQEMKKRISREMEQEDGGLIRAYKACKMNHCVCRNLYKWIRKNGDQHKKNQVSHKPGESSFIKFGEI